MKNVENVFGDVLCHSRSLCVWIPSRVQNPMSRQIASCVLRFLGVSATEGSHGRVTGMHYKIQTACEPRRGGVLGMAAASGGNSTGLKQRGFAVDACMYAWDSPAPIVLYSGEPHTHETLLPYFLYWSGTVPRAWCYGTMQLVRSSGDTGGSVCAYNPDTEKCCNSCAAASYGWLA